MAIIFIRHCLGYLLEYRLLFRFLLAIFFVVFSILVILIMPIYSRYKYNMCWQKIISYDIEYLLWIYIWFYMAWGLNYSQPHFMQRAHIKPVPYTSVLFARFVDRYIIDLNNSYVVPSSLNKEDINREVPLIYRQISDSLKIHAPQHNYLRPKTMLFSNFISSVGVSGYMGPFFVSFISIAICYLLIILQSMLMSWHIY